MCYTISMNITQKIENLVDQYYDQFGLTAKKINSGECMTFAADIVALGFGEAIWGSKVPYDYWSESIQEIWDEFSSHYADGHCFIKYNGKYYDSQCSQGCNYPDELPYYHGVCLTVKYR